LDHEIFRGDVVRVNLDPTEGVEIGKSRPCLIIQNDLGNRASPSTIVAPITDASHKQKVYPFQVFVPAIEGGLSKDSLILCEQIRTIDKRRIVEKLGSLPSSRMREVDLALKRSLGLY
jgi:mRNA interferase MazF